MKVVFIASLSHSGSTLLDLMLNAHPEVISLGELKQLTRVLLMKKRRRPGEVHPCTCHAESLWECPFWSRVNDYMKAKGGRSLAEINVDRYDDPESFYADNRLLFEALAAISGKKYIVDSSKSYRRLKLLLKTPGLDVLPIYLKRDARGQVWSCMKKTKTAAPSLRAQTMRYIWGNLRIENALGDHPYFALSYEDLVARPKATLQALMREIGLDFDPIQLEWASQERHTVAGNRMRWTDRSDLILDQAWRRNLTALQALGIKGVTLPMRLPFFKAGMYASARYFPSVRKQLKTEET